MAKNARTLGIRLDDKTNQRLERFEADTLIEGVSLARAALIASLDAYERQGSLTLPLKITSAETTTHLNDEPRAANELLEQGWRAARQKLHTALNEAPAIYGTPKTRK